MKFNVAKKVQEAGMIVGALGVIGFIGIIWLMIYGNLSGNLGFTDNVTTVINETIEIGSTTGMGTIGGAANENFVSWNATLILNVTDFGEWPTNDTMTEGVDYTINTANGTFFNLTDYWNGTAVTYQVTRQVQGEINTERVIGNVTTGFRTFFGFSDTLFTIAAIVLLIFMLLGLLALVWTIMKMQSGKKSGFSGY